MRDLLVLVADSNMKGILEGLLPRVPKVEQFQPFTYNILTHSNRDAGVRTQSVDFVSGQLPEYRYLLVLLDFEGSGTAGNVEALQATITNDLEKNGWENRVCVVAIDPECDAWLWVNRNTMGNIFQSTRNVPFPPDLDEWLGAKNFVIQNGKPTRPKEAIEALLRHLKRQRSSALYQELAANASYRNCNDVAFLRMINQLRTWFAPH